MRSTSYCPRRMKYSTITSNSLERERAKPAFMSISLVSPIPSSRATAKASTVGLLGR